jgi:hypothetical protein
VEALMALEGILCCGNVILWEEEMNLVVQDLKRDERVREGTKRLVIRKLFRLMLQCKVSIEFSVADVRKIHIDGAFWMAARWREKNPRQAAMSTIFVA